MLSFNMPWTSLRLTWCPASSMHLIRGHPSEAASHGCEQVDKLRLGLGLHAKGDDQRDEADVKNTLHCRPNQVHEIADLEA